MGRRTIQETLASDPAYSGTFDAKGGIGSAAIPIRRPPSPQVPEQQSRSTEASVEAVEAVRVEPSPQPVSEPAAAPAPLSALQPRIAVAPRPASKAKVRSAEAPDAQLRTSVPVRVRPLAVQAERISATGLNPRQVMKAAWRKALESCTVGSTFVAMPEGERAAGPTFQFVTTLMVDAEAMAALTKERDPLGVESPWFLVRGQLEPAFWTALDAILAQLPKPTPS